MGTLRCPTCRKVTVFDPSIPDDGLLRLDTELCMECIFDQEEGHIVRGEK